MGIRFFVTFSETYTPPWLICTPGGVDVSVYTCGSLISHIREFFSSSDAQLLKPPDRSRYSRHRNPNSCYRQSCFFFFFPSLPFLSLSVQFPNTIPIENIITRFREVLQLKPQPAVGIELRTLIVEAHDTRWNTTLIWLYVTIKRDRSPYISD